MSNATIGLIGYGYWGPNLLRNYTESASATVKWVCDVDPAQLAKAAIRYPSVTPTKSLDDVIGDPEVDAVLIATPISSHHALAMQALRAGKHVFVERRRVRRNVCRR
jgi:predicted dehydrogenase